MFKLAIVTQEVTMAEPNNGEQIFGQLDAASTNLGLATSELEQARERGPIDAEALELLSLAVDKLDEDVVAVRGVLDSIAAAEETEEVESGPYIPKKVHASHLQKTIMTVLFNSGPISIVDLAADERIKSDAGSYDPVTIRSAIDGLNGLCVDRGVEELIQGELVDDDDYVLQLAPLALHGEPKPKPEPAEAKSLKVRFDKLRGGVNVDGTLHKVSKIEEEMIEELRDDGGYMSAEELAEAVCTRRGYRDKGRSLEAFIRVANEMLSKLDMCFEPDPENEDEDARTKRFRWSV